MKPGLDQVHVKSILDTLEKKQLHPVDALRILSISSLSILSSFVEYQMTPEEQQQLGAQIDDFAARLRDLVQLKQEDLFAVLLSTQILNRELVDAASLEIELLKEEFKNGNNPQVPSV
jgi:hypothetical protein